MKLKNYQDIWRKPVYLPYLQPPLTEELLAKGEAQLGYKLPIELIELLKIQNGGYIRYHLPQTPVEMIYGLGDYFPSMLMDFNWQEVSDYVSFELEGLIPFDGDGHWFMCLDYREDATAPKVSSIDIECDGQTVIADSFADYLSMLRLEIRDELVVYAQSSLDDAVVNVSKALNIVFGSPDNFSHGYNQYRGEYKKEHIWLSPNLVPAGFVRKDDLRYEELKSKMSSNALQYPELPQNAVILFMYETSLLKEVEHRLLLAGLQVKKLVDEVGL